MVCAGVLGQVFFAVFCQRLHKKQVIKHGDATDIGKGNNGEYRHPNVSVDVKSTAPILVQPIPARPFSRLFDIQQSLWARMKSWPLALQFTVI